MSTLINLNDCERCLRKARKQISLLSSKRAGVRTQELQASQPDLDPWKGDGAANPETHFMHRNGRVNGNQAWVQSRSVSSLTIKIMGQNTLSAILLMLQNGEEWLVCQCCAAVQRDLDRLKKWVGTNFVKLNKDWCRLLHLGGSNPMQQHKL